MRRRRLFHLDSLPDTIIDYPAAGIHAYRHGTPFSTRGWTNLPQSEIGSKLTAQS
jgi:hypothetical protein